MALEGQFWGIKNDQSRFAEFTSFTDDFQKLVEWDLGKFDFLHSNEMEVKTLRPGETSQTSHTVV